MDVLHQADIKPCGYLRCSICRSRQRLSAGGTRNSENICCGRVFSRCNTPSTLGTLNRKRHRLLVAAESLNGFLRKAECGWFTSPTSNLPRWLCFLGKSWFYRTHLLSSCYFSESQAIRKLLRWQRLRADLVYLSSRWPQVTAHHARCERERECI
jgi:hypothetical protein